MFRKRSLLCLLLTLAACCAWGQNTVPQWGKWEKVFASDKTYENPLYEVRTFEVTLTAPSGRSLTLNGFWDGGRTWKFRFSPTETGTWQYETRCSDEDNAGLHQQSGRFECVPNPSQEAIYQHGALQHLPGTYHLAYADGTPFFWLACTAWNGALKSTDEDWDTYLKQRKAHRYNVIQLVTTPWRGCEVNAEGEVPFTGSGRISLNPDFFRRIDQKIDEVNAHGLIASPVLLWALPLGAGRHLSPGYYLPIEEASLLARYLVARYQGNQVVWALGGDGKYVDELEDRWKAIGRAVFKEDTPGLVTLHPFGRSYIGDVYAGEPWYDLMGYQSSHSNAQGTVDWINKGPMANNWARERPMPYINMEPNYEEIHFRITDKDVRNASYWSLFATPVAGITYGANGIWPWLREGEQILNHRDAPGTSTWRKSIDFPGSVQMEYLYAFFDRFDWWTLLPRPAYLVEQPGDAQFDHFIGVLGSPQDEVLLAYVPAGDTVKLYVPEGKTYTGTWYNPRDGKEQPASLERSPHQVHATPPTGDDWLLVLE